MFVTVALSFSKITAFPRGDKHHTHSKHGLWYSWSEAIFHEMMNISSSNQRVKSSRISSPPLVLTSELLLLYTTTPAISATAPAAPPPPPPPAPMCLKCPRGLFHYFQPNRFIQGFIDASIKQYVCSNLND